MTAGTDPDVLLVDDSQGVRTLTFHRPVAVGDRLEVVVTVLEKRPPDLLLLETVIRLASGERVADGVAEVLAPPLHFISVNWHRFLLLFVQYFINRFGNFVGYHPRRSLFIRPQIAEAGGCVDTILLQYLRDKHRTGGFA